MQTIASTTTATGLRVQPSASIHCRCPGARAQALDDRQVAGADCRITAVAGPLRNCSAFTGRSGG